MQAFDDILVPLALGADAMVAPSFSTAIVTTAMTGVPEPGDQFLGTGDGGTTIFALVKHYGDEADQQVRHITRPLAGSVRFSFDGVEQASGWAVTDGEISYDTALDEDVEVRAGYFFDVPVRFAEDRLGVSRATFLTGEAVSVPLIEVRE